MAFGWIRDLFYPVSMLGPSFSLNRSCCSSRIKIKREVKTSQWTAGVNIIQPREVKLLRGSRRLASVQFFPFGVVSRVISDREKPGAEEGDDK
jgi:hypothetical protein